MAKTRHFFAGSNSGKGFYSLFDNIMGPEAKRIYLLKGGPGTGKSSFMRFIADAVGELGHEQERFFCSSDPQALDAVAFPALGIALVDATAPHQIEPTLPGCRDHIISLGAFWDKEQLWQKREEILAAGRVKQHHFSTAFRYFTAALCVEQNRALAKDVEVDYHKLEPIMALFPQEKTDAPGSIRHLFASALTPDGYVSHIQGLVEDLPQCFILQGGFGLGQGEMLAMVADAGQRAGLAVEAFHYPLNPEQILHIVVPELGLAVLTELPLEPLDSVKGPRLVCGPLETSSDLDYQLWEKLLQQGFSSLLAAKTSHIAVEQYYTNSMDFVALNEYRDEILAELLL